MENENEDTEADDPSEILDALEKGEFGKVIPSERSKSFIKFIENSVSFYGGFMISLPLAEGGKAWFFYKLIATDSSSHRFAAPTLFIPENPTDSHKPDNYDHYPVWHLDGGKAVA